MLQEVAGLLPAKGDAGMAADPLELLGREVAAIVAGESARLDDLESRLAELTRGFDSEGRPVGALAARLAGKDAGELAELAGTLGLRVQEPGGTAERPAWPGWPRANLGQLGRALARVPERRPTIAAAWEVLASKDASFARRWAAGVHLCRLTRDLVRVDPSQAAAWAARVGQTAGALALVSGPAGGFESRMADVLGTFASAHVGNALRVQGHLLVSERFWRRTLSSARRPLRRSPCSSTSRRSPSNRGDPQKDRAVAPANGSVLKMGGGPWPPILPTLQSAMESSSVPV